MVCPPLLISSISPHVIMQLLSGARSVTASLASTSRKISPPRIFPTLLIVAIVYAKDALRAAGELRSSCLGAGCVSESEGRCVAVK